MVPDVTHCTPKARAGRLRLVANRIPVIASHIGVQSMNPEPYNLDESDVRAIAASGGVVGVIFMPYWLDQARPRPGPGRDLEDDGHAAALERWLLGARRDRDRLRRLHRSSDDCKSEAELPRIRELVEHGRLARGRGGRAGR